MTYLLLYVAGFVAMLFWLPWLMNRQGQPVATVTYFIAALAWPILVIDTAIAVLFGDDDDGVGS